MEGLWHPTETVNATTSEAQYLLFIRTPYLLASKSGIELYKLDRSLIIPKSNADADLRHQVTKPEAVITTANLTV